MLWFFSEPKEDFGAPAPWSIGGSPAHVIDRSTWCGAATTILYGGRGDPHPLWRSSLVEIGIKVTVVESAVET